MIINNIMSNLNNNIKHSINLDELKLKVIVDLKKTIISLDNANILKEFNKDIKLLEEVMSNIKSNVVTGEAKLAVEILN